MTIRAARLDDHEDLSDVWGCPGVVRETLGLPYVSRDEQKKALTERDPDDHVLVTEKDAKVVGSVNLRRRKQRLAHVGHLEIGVHDDYQNQGIGTALMEAAVDMADNWLNLKRVELHVYTDNEGAIHLYKKFGFVIEGKHRASAFRDGEYVNTYSMARLKD